MLQSLLAKTLKQHLAPYLEGFDAEQLNLAVTKGEIVLHDLKLKSTILADLDLPVQLHKGYIGTLKLKIPWQHLFPTPSKPVIAEVKDIFIVVGPNLDQPFRKDVHEKNERARKDSVIATWEEEWKLAHMSEKEKKAKASFTEKLIASIINNLQVSITGLHVRYEDDVSHQGHPFAAGLTIDAIAAETTDEHFRPAFAGGMPPVVHKLASLSCLSMYLDTDAKMVHKMARAGEDWVSFMATLIPRKTRNVDHQYLLAPVSMTLKLKLNSKGEVNVVPKIDADVHVERFQIDIDEGQYKDLLFLTDGLSRFSRQSVHRHLRPSDVRPRGRKGTRQWWRYCIAAVREDVHKRLQQWSWPRMAARRAHRIKYKQTYREFCSIKKENKSKKALQEELVALEKDMSAEDIVAYRQAVRQQLQDEEKERQKKKNAHKSSGGWFSWLTGHKTHETDTLAETFGNELSEKERNEIYEAIGYDEEDVTGVDVHSKSYVAVKASLLIGKVGVCLRERRREHASAEDRGAILALDLNVLNLDFEQRPAAEAMKVDMAIQSMLVTDEQLRSTPDADTSFCCVLRPRRVRHRIGHRDQGQAASQTTFFSLSFETNPMDKAVDTRVVLGLEPLEVVYVPHVLQRVVEFTAVPEELTALDDVASAAAATAWQLQEQTSTGLMYAIETHTTIDLDVQLGAPTIIIPTDRVVMVADLGHLSVTSSVVDPSTLSVHNVEENMYDRFDIGLRHLQAVILERTPGSDMSNEWHALLSAETTTTSHLLAPTTLDLAFHQCVQQNNPQYARGKFEGTLPSLHVFVSDTSYKHLMELLAVIAPAQPKDAEQQDSSSNAAAAAAAAAPSTRTREQQQQQQQMARPPHSESRSRAGSTSARSPFLPRARAPTAVSQSSGRGGQFQSPAPADDTDDEFFSCDEGSSSMMGDSSSQGSPSRQQQQQQMTEEELRMAMARHVMIEGTFSINRMQVTILDTRSGTALPAPTATEHSASTASTVTPTAAGSSELLTLDIRGLCLERFRQREDMLADLSLERIDIVDHLAQAAASTGAGGVMDMRSGEDSSGKEKKGGKKKKKKGKDKKGRGNKSGVSDAGATEAAKEKRNKPQQKLYMLESNPTAALPGIDYSPVADKLIRVSYAACPPESLLFDTEHDRTKASAKVDVGDLRLTMRQESLRVLMQWAQTTMQDAAAATAAIEQETAAAAGAGASTSKDTRARSSAAAAHSGSADTGTGDKTPTNSPPTGDEDVAQTEAAEAPAVVAGPEESDGTVDMEVRATFGSVQLVLEQAVRPVASFLLAGAEATMTSDANKTAVQASLARLNLADLLHPNPAKQMVVSVLGAEKVFSATAMMWTEQAKGTSFLHPDLTVKLDVAQLRVLFFMRFVTDITRFAAGLSAPEQGNASEQRAPSPARGGGRGKSTHTIVVTDSPSAAQQTSEEADSDGASTVRASVSDSTDNGGGGGPLSAQTSSSSRTLRPPSASQGRGRHRSRSRSSGRDNANSARRSASPSASLFSNFSIMPALSMAERAAAVYKMDLDVTLLAPQIVVPVSSDSDSALVLDLGQLTVSNSIGKEPETAETEFCVVDTMNVKLSNLHMTMLTESKQGGEDDRVSEVVHPVDVEVQLRRALLNVRHSLPDTDLACTISSINLELSDKDYLHIMELLAGNLAEEPFLPEETMPASSTGKTQQQEAAAAAAAAARTGEHKDAEDVRGELDVEAMETEATQPTPARQHQRQQPAIVATSSEPQEPTTAATGTRARSVSQAAAGGASESAGASAAPHVATKVKVILSSVGLLLRKGAQPLCSISLQESRMHAELDADSAIRAGLQVQGLEIVDVRPDSQSQYKALLKSTVLTPSEQQQQQRDAAGSEEEPCMLVARVNVLDGDTGVRMTLRGLDLTVCMDFVMALVGFLPEAPTPTSSKDSSDDSAHHHHQQQPAPPPHTYRSIDDMEDAETNEEESDAFALSTTSTRGSPVPATSQEDEQEHEPSMRVFVEVDDLCATVVADHTDPLSRALRLALDLHAFYSSTATRSSVSANASALRMASLRPWRGQREYVTILQPCTLGLSYSTDAQKDLNIIGVNLDHITMSIGYNDTKIVLAVLEALGSGAEKAEGASDSGKGEAAAGGTSHEVTLDTSEQLLGSDHWYLQTHSDEDATSLLSSESGEDETEGGNRRELAFGRFSPAHMMAQEGDTHDWITRSTAQVEVGSIDITIIDDYEKQDQPLLLLSASLLASAKNVMATDQPLDVWATLSLALAFYNPRVSTWEPVLEPIMDKETQAPRPWQLQAHVRMRQGDEGRLTSANVGRDGAAEGDAQVHPEALPDMLCVVSAADRLEINFTNAFYSVLMSSVFVAGEEACVKDDASVLEHQAVSQEQNPELSHTVMIKREFVEYLFVNSSSHELTLTLHHPNRRNTEDTRSLTVGVEETVPLLFPSETTRQREYMCALSAGTTSSERRVTIDLPGCRPLEGVHVERVGRFGHRLTTADGKRSLWCTVEVSMKGAIKVVSVHSTFQVHNSLHIPLDIACKHGPNMRQLTELAPAESFSLPLTVALKGFYVRPAGLAYDWNPEPITFKSPSRIRVECLASDPTSQTEAAEGADGNRGAASVTAGAEEETDFERLPQGGEELDAALHNMMPMTLQAVIQRTVFDAGVPSLSHPCHTVIFTAPLILRNLLPMPLHLRLSSQDADLDGTIMHLQPGERFPLIARLSSPVQAHVYHSWLGGHPQLARHKKGKKKDEEVGQSGSAGGGADPSDDTESEDGDEGDIHIPEDAWQGPFVLYKPGQRNKHHEQRVMCEREVEGQTQQLHLTVLSQPTGTRSASTLISVAAPYWIVNQTGRAIRYRQRGDGFEGPSMRVHPADQQQPELFSLGVRPSTTARFALEEHDKWSEAQRLDTVGHSFPVELSINEEERRATKMAVNVSLATGNLTKIITLLPRYMLHNKSSHTVWCAEACVALSNKSSADDGVIVLEPGACVPFWPEKDNALLRVLLPGADKPSNAFSIANAQDISLLSPIRDNDFRVIRVGVRPNDATMVASFTDFDGLADVRIENRCRSKDLTVEYRQAGSDEPFHAVDVLHERSFVRPLATGKKELEIRLPYSGSTKLTHTLGKFYVKQIAKHQGQPVYLVSFPDNAQPVLLFTDNRVLASKLRRVCGLVRDSKRLRDQELAPRIHKMQSYFSVALTGIGLSLVDDKPSEVAYLSINSREAWEFALDTSNQWGEDWERLGVGAVKKLNEAVAAGRDTVRLNDNITADLLNGVLRVPSEEHPIPLRRHLHPGLALTYVDCEYTTIYRVVLEDLQLDNQTPDVEDTTVLSIAPPAQSVFPQPSAIKILLVETKQLGAATQVRMLPRVSVLLQKMNLFVTDTFAFRMVDVFKLEAPPEDALAQVDVGSDVTWAEEKRLAIADGGGEATAHSRISIRSLQLHPISIVLTLRLQLLEDGQGGDEDDQSHLTQYKKGLVEEVLSSIGTAASTLSSISGTHLRLNSLILNNVFCEQDELVADVVSHYTSEGLKQAYKLLMGLDLLGNPGQMLGHLSSGVSDLYYEPLVEGISSIATHTLAGATGMVSSLTGAVGNAMAALSLDAEYQRERRQAAGARRSAVQHLSHGGERFVRGLFEGTTGLVMQPLQGAQKGGVGGFFKGMGRGLMGLVTKPVVGVIDMTTGTIDMVRQAIQGDKRTNRVREPRSIRPDNILRPYSPYEAHGVVLLAQMKQHMSRGQMDRYVMHFVLKEGTGRRAGHRVVLFTNRGVVVAPLKDMKHPVRVPHRLTKTHRIVSSKGIELSYEEKKGNKRKARKLMIPARDKHMQEVLEEAYVKAKSYRS